MNGRDKGKEGGVLIAVRRSLISSEIFKSNNTELISVKVHHSKRSSIISAFYRPPSKQDHSYLNQVYEDFTHLKYLSNAYNLWIAGDFNFPDINWNNMSVLGTAYPNNMNKFFIDTIEEISMEQIVDFPPRLDNILDLVFTTHPSLVNKCKPLPGIENHDIVLIDTSIEVTRSKTPRHKIYIWKSANTDEISKVVKHQTDKFMLSTFNSIDDMWSNFKNILLNAMGKHVPSKPTSSRPTYPWITTAVRRGINRKNKAGRKARKAKKPKDRERYRKLKAQAQRTSRQAYNNYVHDIINPEQTENPTRFWSFIKSKKQDNSGVAPLRGNDGLIYSDSNNKVDIINTQFKSAYTQEESSLPDLGQSSTPLMPDISISFKGVHKLLSELKIHKAVGPDSISPRLLREVADIIAPALTRIYQASLDTGTVPTDWRTANIVPIFKKGDKSKASNYRAICSKMLEHIIHSNVMDHLTYYNILSDSQHGFRDLVKHSSLSQYKN